MFAIKMPKSGQTTDESLIARWNKKIGDPVKRGDSLISIETDKATLEVESYCDGYLRASLFKEGQFVSAGEIVAYVGQIDEPLPDEVNVKVQPAGDDDEYKPIMLLSGEDDKLSINTVTTLSEQLFKEGVSGTQEHDNKVLASPKAKRAAKELGVPLTSICTQNNDIIKYENVMSKYTNDIRVNRGNLKSETQNEAYYITPLTAMRTAIARKMCESAQTIPQYTVTVDINMENTIRLRNILNNELGNSCKIAYHDLLAICVARAIADHPNISATFTEDGIKIYNGVHIGLAVSLEQGLVVPVVRDVQSKSLSEIASENSCNIAKAKEGKLTGEDMTGGTITISNLGMYGVECFTALINPPESCILAMGSISEKPVKVSGEMVFRNYMTLTAAFDHRLIDGAVGASFLHRVKKLMESPEVLLL